MGAKGIEFDGKKSEYLGAPAVDHLVCAIAKASGIGSIEKWFGAKEPVRFGGVGPGGFASDLPRVLAAALGLPSQSYRRLQRHLGHSTSPPRAASWPAVVFLGIPIRPRGAKRSTPAT